jgi:hypothetical protein
VFYTWEGCGAVVRPLRVVNIIMGKFRLTILVVLLDEADVFLEERSLADMERNALVSGKLPSFRMSKSYVRCSIEADILQVFLRVLEYYDG